MKIIDILKENKETLSFEVFPPKKESGFDTIWEATEKIAQISPSFMSVTYGAGGGASRYTIDVARNVQEKFDVPMLAHLTCVGSTKEGLRQKICKIKEAGIENVMALRGDITDENIPIDYNHAIELVRELKSPEFDFCVAGACYPEMHPESRSQEEDLIHLKEKVDAGCDFLTTQMFFENELFYKFMDKAYGRGIKIPVVAGVMPVTSIKQIENVVKLSNSYLPHKFVRMVEKYEYNPEDMKRAGIEYAISQIQELREKGIGHIHVYTMNRPKVAEEIWKKLF